MNRETLCRFILFPLTVFLDPLRAAGDENRWWPVQAMPKAVVRLENPGGCSSVHASCEKMAQSVAGLASKAVNEGRADEMVRITTGNADVEYWFARELQRQRQLERRGAFGLRDLVDRYVRKGVIKGYILCRWDRSTGDDNEQRAGMDCSVNVATRLSTVRGHLQTSTDWCMNLPVLMAGTEKADPPRVRDFDPRTIDWGDARSAVSFITSDGDNSDLSGSTLRRSIHRMP